MRSAPRAFSLLEVLVALLLLSVGALALAGGIGYAVRARDRALGSALGAASAEAWLEAWRASGWTASADSGSAAVSWGARRGSIEWRVSLPRPCLAEGRVAVTPGGRAAVTTVLVTRRFRESVAGCGP